MPEVPYKVEKPWGHELIWARTDAYVGKVLHVILRVKEGDRLVARPFRAGESAHIPPTLVHQIEAVVDSDVLEASTNHLDDLVRLEDRYGRG